MLFRFSESNRSLRKTRILPLSLVTGLACAFLLGISGAGAAPIMNQLFDLGTTAVTNVWAGFSSLALNNDTLTQEEDGNANQSADTAADADSALEVSADLVADNVVQGRQIAAADQTNQDISGHADAQLGVALLLDAAALNAQETTQEATGVGPVNQEAQQESAAAAIVLSETLGTALNAVTAEQESKGDQANQIAGPQANAAANAATTAIGTSSNAGTVSQSAPAAGPVNQFITNVFNTNTFIDTLQQITSTNILSILQICNGQCSQVANVIANSIANGLQSIIGDSSVVANLSQESTGDGPANQQMEGEHTSETEVSGDQVVTSSNTIVLTQEGDEQSNQEANIAADSAADGTQVILGTSVVLVDAAQSADGDGAVNQDMDLHNDSQTDAEGTQEVVSFNIIDVAQQNGGSQGNQAADIVADSEAVAVQVIDGTSLILLSAGQSAGSDGGVNQSADAHNASAAHVSGQQGVVSFNAADLDQNNDGDQGNQQALLVLDAGAAGTQLVTGASVIVAALEQDADGTNQHVNAHQDSTADVAAEQAIVSGNTADVSQSASADQGTVSQNADVVAGSFAAGNQAAGGISMIVTGVMQEAEGEGAHNQDATVASDSETTVGALQGVLATNVITTGQEADITRGAGAQSLIVEPVAIAVANQEVMGMSGNVSGIGQSANDGDANQAAAIDAVSATHVGAQQDVAAVNAVDATQEQHINQGAGAQWALVAPVAVAEAGQQVAGTSGNVSGISQDAGDGVQGNQGAAIDAASETQTEASQNAVAINDVTLRQTANADRGAVAQAGEVAPIAVTLANQNVVGTAENVTDISQTGDGDQGNQGAMVGVDAASQVAAQQNALTVNAVDITQECDVTRGACAQYFYVMPTATTTADQNVAGTAGNVTGVSQEGGDGAQGNQDATVQNSAETDVQAAQNALTDNTTVVHQACTATMNVCAQYTEVGVAANTQAVQNVVGDASNTTVIEQSGAGDQGNQAADVTDTAQTTMDVNQSAATVNDTVIQQIGSDNGNQAASVTGNANTATTVNISGASTNTTAITQE